MAGGCICAGVVIITEDGPFAFFCDENVYVLSCEATSLFQPRVPVLVYSAVFLGALRRSAWHTASLCCSRDRIGRCQLL